MMQKDGVVINDTVGRKQQVQVVNESGLYHLTITSRKEFAKRFRKWLTAEVASGIHKYGIDVINEAILTPSQPGSDNSHNKNQAKKQTPPGSKPSLGWDNNHPEF